MELINWNDLKFWLLLVWWIALIWIIAMNAVSKIVSENGRDKERWLIYSILFTPIITVSVLFILENLILKKKNALSKKEKGLKNYKNIAIITFIYSITALITSMFGYLNNTIDTTAEGIFFSFISLMVSIYIFSNIKEIINNVYGKRKINIVIYLYILIEIISYFCKFYMYRYEVNLQNSNIFMIIGIILMMSYGIIGIVYGRGIKRVTVNSDFKMYGNFLIISSMFMVTVLGFFIAGILNAIAYFYLSIIFKNNERAVQEKNGENEGKDERIEEAEKYFNCLNLIEYERIKDEAIKYLPKELSEEDKKNAILNHITKNYMWQ